MGEMINGVMQPPKPLVIAKPTPSSKTLSGHERRIQFLEGS